MKMFDKKKKDDWAKLAEKEIKNKNLDDLLWKTPEGIEVKSLYTMEDLIGLNHINTFPGFPPYVRGP